MNSRVFTILLLALIVSCNTVDKDGFSELDESIRYKRAAIGEEEFPVTLADVISLEVTVRNSEGVIAAKSYHRVLKKEASFPSYFSELLNQSWQGDSMVIRGPSHKLKLGEWFHREISIDSSILDLEIRIEEALSDSSLRQLLANERLRLDLELRESSLLKRTLDSLDMNQDYFDGIYLKPLKEGDGVIPINGQFVRTHYTMHLPNGKELMNTHLDEPFEYQVGKPDQAIPGFALAVKSMKVGGEYLVVIPSIMGFGQEGSSSGIVPPYAVLICKIELLSAG